MGLRSAVFLDLDERYQRLSWQPLRHPDGSFRRLICDRAFHE